MSGQTVTGIEPFDLTRPEDVEAGCDCLRIVQRRDAEIDRFGLMIDLH